MSDSAANTVYVVTGANRGKPPSSSARPQPLLLTPLPGIGLGLVTALLARPSTTVVAVAREPSIAGLESELAAAPKGTGSTFHTFALNAGTIPAPTELRGRFTSKIGLTRVDILIANAGMATSMVPALETTAEDLQTHFAVNTTAPLVLFQALWPLMKAAPSPKLFNISSSVGSIEISELPGGAYGPSKAALNWITRRLHAEHEKDGLVSVAVHPGWVQTANGDFAARAWGYPGKPPLTIDQSVDGVLQVVDGATRETTSGKFVSYDGQILPW